MSKEKMQAPQGMAGLVRYFDEEKSAFKLKPQHIIELISIIVILELVLTHFI